MHADYIANPLYDNRLLPACSLLCSALTHLRMN